MLSAGLFSKTKPGLSGPIRRGFRRPDTLGGVQQSSDRFRQGTGGFRQGGVRKGRPARRGQDRWAGRLAVVPC